jgi:hypothetical protein
MLPNIDLRRPNSINRIAAHDSVLPTGVSREFQDKACARTGKPPNLNRAKLRATSSGADNPERHLTLRLAEPARGDFAAILDELDFVTRPAGGATDPRRG